MRAEWRIHPDLQCLDPVVESTYGTYIFQEQILEALKVLCGWSYSDADLVFSSLRKKDEAKLAQAKPQYLADGIANGVSPDGLEAFWDVLEPFASYSFNRAHSVGYAYITYWTAYLFANHPIEYLTSMMSEAKDQEKILEYIKEARRLGILVLPPDVNESGLGFTATPKGIRYGLGAIKGVGEASLQELLVQRPYRDLDDFFRRADGQMLNARVLSALIRSGGLDSVWRNRTTALAEAERLSSLAGSHRRKSTFGELPLLRGRYEPRALNDRDWTEYLQGELDTIGLRLSFPSLILRARNTLSDAQVSWLTTVLSSREPESEVFLEIGSTLAKLPLRSSEFGLAEVLGMIDVEVQVA